MPTRRLTTQPGDRQAVADLCRILAAAHRQLDRRDRALAEGRPWPPPAVRRSPRPRIVHLRETRHAV